MGATFPPTTRPSRAYTPQGRSQTKSAPASHRGASSSSGGSSYPTNYFPNPAKRGQVSNWLMMLQDTPAATTSAGTSMRPQPSSVHQSVTPPPTHVTERSYYSYDYLSTPPSGEQAVALTTLPAPQPQPAPRSQPTGSSENLPLTWDVIARHPVMPWLNAQPSTFSVSNAMPPSMTGACDLMTNYCPQHGEDHLQDRLYVKYKKQDRRKNLFVYLVLGFLGVVIITAIILGVVLSQKK